MSRLLVSPFTLIPLMMAWKCESWQYSAMPPVYAPTGEYNLGSLANVGRNCWTFDPTFQVSYHNAKTGFNAAIFTGIMLNSDAGDSEKH